jgi:hypothetical protein
MLSRRCYLLGLFASLLALIAQLGAGATVPRFDPVAQLIAAEILCHVTDEGRTPNQAPNHSDGCLACWVCTAVHPQIPLVPEPPNLTLSRIQLTQRAELPPPARASPSRVWLLYRPRAPPSAS